MVKIFISELSVKWTDEYNENVSQIIQDHLSEHGFEYELLDYDHLVIFGHIDNGPLSLSEADKLITEIKNKI